MKSQAHRQFTFKLIGVWWVKLPAISVQETCITRIRLTGYLNKKLFQGTPRCVWSVNSCKHSKLKNAIIRMIMVPELSIFVVAECLRNLGTAKHHCQEVREHRYEHLKHTLKLLWGRGRDRVICRSILSFESKGCVLQYFVSLGNICKKFNY